MKRALLFLLSFISMIPLAAQTNTTPARTTPPVRSADNTTVLTEADFLRYHAASLAELLRHVPGVQVRQHSSFGGRTTVYLSGMSAGAVAVYRDGVLLNPGSSGDGACDIAHITLDGVERVEIIRGVQSVKFPGASAGVIHVVSKRGGVGQSASLSLRGSFPEGFYGAFNAAAGIDQAYFSLSASQLLTRGESRAIHFDGQNAPGIERDGYNRSLVQASAGVNPGSDLWFAVSMYYQNADVSLDDRAYEDDPNRAVNDKLIALDARYSQSLTPWWKHAIILDAAVEERNERDATDAFDAGESLSAFDRTFVGSLKWQNVFTMGDFNKLNAGAEFLMNMLSHHYDAQNFEGMTSIKDEGNGYMLAAASLRDTAVFFKALTIDAGVRLNWDIRTNLNIDYRVAALFTMNAVGIDVHAAYGHATRYASDKQQLMSVTHGSLAPEITMHAIEAGVRQRIGGMLTMDAFGSYSILTNVISYDINTGSYTNVPGASILSATVELAFKPVSRFTAAINYTFVQANYLPTGVIMPERPRHSAHADIAFEPFEKFLISLGLHYVGPRTELLTTAGTNSWVALLDHGLVDAGVSYTWEFIDLFVKAENILSLIPSLRPAVDVAGYYGYPFAFTVGATARF
ncbi:MAG: TonB-dependent receptor plug domain-containing protein [Spirochaetota bacterium]